ncbi:MAG: 2-dehydropantoate 2-reductase [Planctomycetota bacterium]
MAIAVVGAGVVGGILGGCLLKAGREEVILVDAFSRRLDQLRAGGLKIKDPKNCIKGDFTVAVPKAISTLCDIEPEKVAVVFICVKACMIADIIDSLKPLAKAGAVFVSFQNGLDTEEALAHELGGDGRILRGVVNYAGRLLEDGAVEVSFFQKPNYLGALSGGSSLEAARVAAMMTQAGLETRATDDIKTFVWEKVLLNSAMSPLCALTGLTMKDVIDRPDLKQVVEGVLREGIAVAKASGARFPDDFFEHCAGYLSKGGRHKPSMLVDVEAKRPTEIEFLNGAIFRHGQRLAIATPHNQTITALIKGLEANRQGQS